MTAYASGLLNHLQAFSEMALPHAPRRVGALRSAAVAILLLSYSSSGGCRPLGEGRAGAASASLPALPAERLDRLSRAFESGEYGALDSILILQAGSLVFERHAPGVPAHRPHTMQSVTKSITSLLVGIVIDQGVIAGVDRPVLELLPGERVAGVDRSSHHAIRLADLLTMRAGLEWDEQTAPWGSPENDLGEMYRRSSDWVRHVLTRRLADRPGTTFRYNSGGTLLLGAILEAATGSEVEELARHNLFGPLGIQSASWRYESPTGLAHTGGGLYLAPLDLARIGLLLLDGGEWEGERIVSRRWIDESFRAHVTEVGKVAGWDVDYGYLWWILPARGASGEGDEGMPKVIFARGAEGQHLFLVPELDLVVVSTGRSHGPAENAPVELLVREILPAVQAANGGRV